MNHKIAHLESVLGLSTSNAVNHTPILASFNFYYSIRHPLRIVLKANRCTPKIERTGDHHCAAFARFSGGAGTPGANNSFDGAEAVRRRRLSNSAIPGEKPVFHKVYGEASQTVGQ
jgi:hypothetical protein